MKKTAYCLLIIIIANILFIEFYFFQDLYKIIALFSFFVLVLTIHQLSSSLSQSINKNDNACEKELTATFKRVKISIRQSTVIYTFSIVVLASFHIWGYFYLLKYKNDDLSEKGIYTGAVVTSRKLEKRSENLNGYYIYYSYKYNGKIYQHSCMNNSDQVGDTIIVKFLPNNPDRHLIMKKEQLK